jgi:glycosyltransferase involved in cell wall biosynthesis
MSIVPLQHVRIAQIAPLYESVPPTGYGGTERVVSWLTEELVRRGHEVTLFASGDSATAARLIAGCPGALRPAGLDHDVDIHQPMLDDVFARADRGEFDVLHFHTDDLHLPRLARSPHPALTTLHGRLDRPEQRKFRRFARQGFVSISQAQRRPLPELRWLRTVYHGLPRDLHTYRGGGGDYLAFLGRLSPEKGFAHAVEIAARAGMRLLAGGKRDRHDRAYIETIEPLLALPHVEFVGEIGGSIKDDLLGGARALLFPICWPEPFGLVMIEAMACGTPVIAYRHGSVPEVIDRGRTGFVVDDLDQAVAAVARLDELDRAVVRATFDERFSVGRMTDDYLAIYRDLIASEEADARPPTPDQPAADTASAALRASGT